MLIDLKDGAWTFILSSQEVQKQFDPENKTQLSGSVNYTPDKDVVRAPMKLMKSSVSVEQLTWGFINVTDTGGELGALVGQGIRDGTLHARVTAERPRIFRTPGAWVTSFRPPGDLPSHSRLRPLAVRASPSRGSYSARLRGPTNAALEPLTPSGAIARYRSSGNSQSACRTSPTRRACSGRQLV